MIKYTRLHFTILLVVIAFGAQAQSTTSSPYSKFGLGDINSQQFPQSIGMGGISTAINNVSGFNNINQLNPASYAAISYTAIDVGMYANFLDLSKTGFASQSNKNYRFSHVAFAFPVTKHSAISFGLLPYSEVGYNYKQSLASGFGTPSKVDTSTVNYLYTGDGGLSKTYLGYGFTVAKHLFLGANASFIFGNLLKSQSTEIPGLNGALNYEDQQSDHISGLAYDYGVQYTIDFSLRKHLVFGYSASSNSKLNSQTTDVISQYIIDGTGTKQVASDTLANTTSAKSKIQLPRINHFGISYQKDNSFLIGADFTMGNWSALTINGATAGLQNSKTFNIGGQITPNINALSNYLALIDYRLGAIYDETYLNVNNTSIKRYAVTFGLGMPIPHDRASNAFYKVNISAEVGKRGTLTNNLIQENYVNIHLAFTFNDRWFLRYKFE